MYYDQLEDCICRYRTPSSSHDSTGLDPQRLHQERKNDGRVRTLSFPAGESPLIEITNATFTTITIEGPAKQAIYLKQGTMVLNATQFTFRNFQSEVKHESPLACTNTKTDCESKTDALPFQDKTWKDGATGQALTLVLAYSNWSGTSVIACFFHHLHHIRFHRQEVSILTSYINTIVRCMPNAHSPLLCHFTVAVLSGF